MERIPLTLLALALILIGAGCTGGDAAVSTSEEAKFKNPGEVDTSKIPADAFKPKGPAYVGEPSGATGNGGTSGPPPEALRPPGQ